MAEIRMDGSGRGTSSCSSAEVSAALVDPSSSAFAASRSDEGAVARWRILLLPLVQALLASGRAERMQQDGELLISGEYDGTNASAVHAWTAAPTRARRSVSFLIEEEAMVRDISEGG